MKVSICQMPDLTPVLVSRCLLGVACRYHGRQTCLHSRIKQLIATGRYVLIDVCPEVDGGLPTPRPPIRLIDHRAMADGRDVMPAMQRGAEIAAEIAMRHGAIKAYLTRGSPACDRDKGVAAGLLQAMDIKVIRV